MKEENENIENAINLLKGKGYRIYSPEAAKNLDNFRKYSDWKMEKIDKANSKELDELGKIKYDPNIDYSTFS